MVNFNLNFRDAPTLLKALDIQNATIPNYTQAEQFSTHSPSWFVERTQRFSNHLSLDGKCPRQHGSSALRM